MKIAVVTAIFGGKDTQKPFAAQSVPCDYFCFTEANSPVPLPNLPDRLKAKYFKLQMHRVLPGYDAYVWIDGNVEVTSADFVKVMTDDLSGIRIQKHHERQTIGEEIDFIMKSDNVYLTTRYGAQPLKQEYEFYLNDGMRESAPLYSCNIFSYKTVHPHRGDTVSVDFMNNWWMLCLEWSWFDQSAFSFLQYWDGCVETVELGPMFNNPHFVLHSHTKPLE